MLILYLLTFFTPFEYLGAFETLTSFTLRVSNIFALLLFFLALYYFISGKIKTFKLFSIPQAFLLFFYFFSLVSILNSPNLERSVLVLAFIVFTSSLVFIFPQIVSQKVLYGIIRVLFWACLIVSTFGIYQFVGDFVGLPTGLKDIYTKEIFNFPRIQSTFSEPLYFANFLLFPIGIFVSLFLANKESFYQKIKLSKTKVSLLIILMLINFILTLSRGAYLALAVLLFILFFFYLKRILRPSFFIPFLAFVIVVISASTFLLYRFDTSANFSFFDDFLEQATNISKGAGVWERQETIKEAVALIPHHYLLGWGPGSFGPLVSESDFIPPTKPKIGWPIVNNETLEILVEHGITGLIFISLFFVFLIRKIWRKIKEEENSLLRAILIGLLVSILASLVQYQTFSTLYISYFWFFVALGLSVTELKSKN